MGEDIAGTTGIDDELICAFEPHPKKNVALTGPPNGEPENAFDAML